MIGHADSGKSTLCSQLLFMCLAIDDEKLQKTEQEASEASQGSNLKYAWLVDESKNERDKGITRDVKVRNFLADGRNYTIIDTPRQIG